MLDLRPGRPLLTKLFESAIIKRWWALTIPRLIIALDVDPVGGELMRFGAPLPNSSSRRLSQETPPPAHDPGDRPSCLKLHLRGLAALVAGCCRALRTRFRVRKGAPRY